METKIFKKNSDFIKEALSFIIFINPKTIALSGGNTPKKLYGELSKIKKSRNIHFFQTDERYVAKNHPASNYKMIKKNLKPKIFHYFDTSLQIAKALKNYDAKLPKKFDITILGIGKDGHIASLFPQSKALKNKLSVAHTTTTQFAIKDRLTLTFSTILKSKNILILLKGKKKLPILKKLQNLQNSKITANQIKNFPALKLLTAKHAKVFLFYLD